MGRSSVGPSDCARFLLTAALLLPRAVDCPAEGLQPPRGFGGESTVFHLAVADTADRNTPVKAHFLLKALDLVVAEGNIEIPMAGGQREAAIPLTLPAVKIPVRSILQVSMEGRESDFPVWIFPPLPKSMVSAFAAPWVVYVDAPRPLRELADRIEGRARFITSDSPLPTGWRVAIVNGNRINGQPLLKGAWGEEVLKNCDHLVSVLCNPGGQATVQEWPGGVMTEVGMSEVDSSVVDTFPLEWMEGWPQARGMRFPPTGNFAVSVTWSLPDSPHVVSPLLAFPPTASSPLGWRNGWTLHCSLPLLERVNEDPAAGALLTALVNQASILSSHRWQFRSVVAVAGPSSPTGEALARLCPSVVSSAESAAENSILLVDPSTADLRGLRRAWESGKKRPLILLGITPEDIPQLDWLLPEDTRAIPVTRPDQITVEGKPPTAALFPGWPIPLPAGTLMQELVMQGLSSQWLQGAVEGEKVWGLSVTGQSSVTPMAGGGASLLWRKEGLPIIAWQIPVQNELGHAALRCLLTNAGLVVAGEGAPER